MKILYPVFLFIFLLTSCAKEEDEVSLGHLERLQVVIILDREMW